MKMKLLKTAHFFGISGFSRLIQRQTGPYSHSAVYLGDAEHAYISNVENVPDLAAYELMEQWPHGGKIKSWMDYSGFKAHTKGTEYQIWALEIPEIEWEFCLDHWILSCKNKKPYDWAGIAHFEIKSIKEDPEKTFCSEEILTPLALARNWDTVKPFNFHPTALVNMIQAAGGFILKKGTV